MDIVLALIVIVSILAIVVGGTVFFFKGDQSVAGMSAAMVASLPVAAWPIALLVIANGSFARPGAPSLLFVIAGVGSCVFVFYACKLGLHSVRIRHHAAVR